MNIKNILFLLTFLSFSLFAEPLHLSVYNPQENGIFPVSSTLVSGPTEAILFDAQFNTKDGEKLVELIKNSRKVLKQIIITSGDPDFYFGLAPLAKAFPEAKVVASPKVVEHILATKDAKLKYWSPKIRDGAPKKLIVPQVTAETIFTVDGEPLELHHSNKSSAYVWIPANKAILGGTSISSGIHVWTADNQTIDSRNSWVNTLKEMENLKPLTVIPGHYLGERPKGDLAIKFTIDYLEKFEKALENHKDSNDVIKTMVAAYPQLAEKSSLELSAKVNTGEVKW
ncbi:MAG TPA: Vmh family MBL fold metallo-hydrolase [Arsenophonus apicola]|uniref:Vmh family MBL fold metallo-hydrolase n=1 Tax=Arsenophonus apicola TaxID=2879119 RepID=UPI001CDD06A2|nr:Vmh family MBL fold metallo-hydrolase [Arsenophonus apicola]UBX30797.1 MBL fold metallo-hydrolase [Arsenophonus apicola]